MGTDQQLVTLKLRIRLGEAETQRWRLAGSAEKYLGSFCNVESLELVFQHVRRRNALPRLWTTARLGVLRPPMNKATPTTPSRPTTAISAEAPSASTCSSETMAVVGKYTWSRPTPDS